MARLQQALLQGVPEGSHSMTEPEQDFPLGLKAEILADVAELLNSRPDDRPLLPTREIAQRASVDARTVRNWIESGRLASVKIEGVRRVEPRVWDEFVAQGRGDG